MLNMDRKISVIGLGYVGLPVAVAFGKLGRTIGYDINTKRINELKRGSDKNGEISKKELSETDIYFTNRIEDLKKADFHIIAVPTPISEGKQPDLTPILNASENIGKALKKGDVVVYESTVYPGVTEEECIPVLEKVSGLKNGCDFKVGYSPERINPGDKERTLDKIIKVVSGQDEEALHIIANTYQKIIKAGVHKVSSIKVAEAAKVIENTQRDLNIALMNELAIVFNKIGIDTNEVLEAAGTKWNFLKFKPGLVGGHCIGVDPYYLTHKAEKVGYHPQVILAGRRINDSVGRFVASQTIKELNHAGYNVLGNTITVLGLTFKENCRDIRNTGVIGIIEELKEYGANVQVHDPLADPEDAKREYDINLIDFKKLKPAAAIIIAVAHDFYKKLMPIDLKKLSNGRTVIVDVKGIYSPSVLKEEGFRFWRL